MKKITLLLSLLFIVLVSQSQLRYANSIFDRIDTLLDVEYALADFLNNKIGLLSDYNIHDGESNTESRPLLMDIFIPQADTVNYRPAIIFAHSGAFLIGSRKADDMIAFCDSFARRGYVTATIDYRMGMGSTVSRFLGIPTSIKIEHSNGYRSAYRAGQDARAAIRFLKHNAQNYGIDTTKIFFAGSSAGGILGLYNIYNDKPGEFGDAILEFPYLGTIDQVGVQGYDGKADAVVSMWGALQDTKYIENEDTPLFLIHGTDDPIVPFKKGIPLDSVVPENPILSFTMPETYGSYCVDTALTNRNIYHETYFQEGGIHEFYGTDTGTFYENGPTQYWDTIQNKITRFFFHLFQPEADFDYSVTNLSVDFLNTSSAIKYSLWDFGDGTTGSGKEFNHIYAEQGTYKVHLTTCNQNMACDTITKNVTTGTPVSADILPINQVVIYPNPVKDRLYISGVADSFEAVIYDVSGRNYFRNENIQHSSIDVSSLQNGFYFIKIKIENQSIVRKFIKGN